MLTRAIIFVKLILTGHLRFCSRCGDITECYRYGRALHRHYEYVKECLMPDFVAPQIISRYTNDNVCFSCCGRLAKMEKAHSTCCDVLARQKKDSNHKPEDSHEND